MKKNVLGKGLEALIPIAGASTRNTPEQEVEPPNRITEPTTRIIEPPPPKDKELVSENPQQTAIPEENTEPENLPLDPESDKPVETSKSPDETPSGTTADSTEKKIFFNPKTGKYEEIDPSRKRSYDTREMPVVSGRRSSRTYPTSVPVHEKKHTSQRFSSNVSPKIHPSLQISKPTQRQEISRREITHTEPANSTIREFSRNELEIRLKNQDNLIRGIMDRMRYLEKKLSELREGSTESPPDNTPIIEKVKNHVDTVIQEIKRESESLRSELDRHRNLNEKINRFLEQKENTSAPQETGNDTADMKKQLQELTRRLTVRERQMFEMKKEIDLLKASGQEKPTINETDSEI